MITFNFHPHWNTLPTDLIHKYGLPFKYVTITGNGGAGKSYSLTSLEITQKRMCCMASTNKAGNVLNSYLTEFRYINNVAVYNTLHSYFCMNPQECDIYFDIIFNEHIHNEDLNICNFSKIQSIWDLLYDSLKVVFGRILEKLQANRDWLSPDEWDVIRNQVREDYTEIDAKSFLNNEYKSETERMVEYARSLISDERIPTPLKYNIIAIDEAERLSGIFIFFFSGISLLYT